MELKNLNHFVKRNHRYNMKEEFIRLCSDKDYKNYVYHLGIKEEKLYPYAFLLKDAVDMRKKCRNCPGYLDCSHDVKGHLFTPREEERRIIFDYVPCSLCEEYLESTKNITYYDVPENIRVASFQQLYKDDKARVPIIKYFKDFTDSYKNGKRVKGIFLTGSFGSGKTYMIAAFFNELSKIGVRSTIVYYPEFLTSLKASFGDDFQERLEYVKTSPILLIDDIGSEKCSSWNRDEILSPILQYRMDEGLPTFFTSNFNLEELEEHLSITSSGMEKVKARRILERIKQQSEVMSLITKNRRV